VERRLVLRFEYRPHGFLDDPVYHVRNAQTSLPFAACFRYPYSPDISRLVATIEQLGSEHRQDLEKMFVHLFDALPVGTWGTPIRRDLVERLF
jgi:hypothetical protein